MPKDEKKEPVEAKVVEQPAPKAVQPTSVPTSMWVRNWLIGLTIVVSVMAIGMVCAAVRIHDRDRDAAGPQQMMPHRTLRDY